MMLLACFFLFVGGVMAQTKVSGTVASAEDGEPVIGAAIKVVGTNTGTVTDINGHFSLVVPDGSKIHVSYIGMKPQTLKASSNMKILLSPENKTLDEVMVVAFGKQTRSSFTGSAAVVDTKDLNKKIATNVADALVGTVPGLQITGSSGAPGASQGAIHIRGIGSISASTSPLIIVDGAPYTSSLSNIPQGDIESVTVLKDASSAALYGARGANGVILITTKNGGDKGPRVSVDAKWGGTSRCVQDYDMINDPAQYMETYYGMLYNYAHYKKGLSETDANQWVNARMISSPTYGLQYNPFKVPDGQGLIGMDGKINPQAVLGNTYTAANGKTYYIVPDDWKDAAYRHGFRQEYNVSVNGTSQKLNYYTSFGYLKEKGVVVKSAYERVTARFKADYQAFSWLRTYANAGYVHSNTESNPNLSNTSTSYSNMGYVTQYIAPIYPLFVRTLDASGKPQIETDQYGHKMYDYGVNSVMYDGYPGLVRPFSSTSNPIGSNIYNDDHYVIDQFQGQLNFDVTLAPWLKFTSNNSVNVHLYRYSYYGNPYVGNSKPENGNIDKANSVSYRHNYVQMLNFHKDFGMHDVQAMVGHEWYKQHLGYLEALARGGFSPDIQEINAFSDRYDSYSYATNYDVEGYFGNVLYNYDQRYFAQASYRRDASSRFAKSHRWGDFWSVGGAWILSKENFFKNLGASWVDNLKLKVSIGQQGNDGIPDFEYLERYSLSKGKSSMLPSFSQIGNEEISWETTTNFNIGLEFALFGNRLNGEFNWYNKKTTDMLFWLNVPESMGVRGYYGNIGDTRNRGVELMLSGDIIRTKDIVWSVTANIAHNNAKILKLAPQKTKNYGGFSMADVNAGFNVSMWYADGEQRYCAMLPDYAGVNENGESLWWVDEDLFQKYGGDHATQSSGDQPGKKHSYTTTDWSQATYYLHNMLPWANGGFSTTLSFYGFDLTATFDYQLGGKIYDYGYASLMNPVSTKATGRAMHKDVLKSWTPDHTATDIPRYQYGDQMTVNESTRFLVSARYLNFQSFTLGYTLPKQWVHKALLSNVRVYVQGENICFWSTRKGLDPRFSFQGTTATGVNSYAPVRTIMGGIQLSF